MGRHLHFLGFLLFPSRNVKLLIRNSLTESDLDSLPSFSADPTLDSSHTMSLRFRQLGASYGQSGSRLSDPESSIGTIVVTSCT